MTEQTDDKPKPRMVSWTRYAAHRSAKTILMLTGVWVGTVGVLLCGFCFICLPCLLITVGMEKGARTGKGGLIGTVLLVAIGIVGSLMVKAGLAASTKSKSMESVVPMTQNRAAHLPAQESLVRASTEPTQPQQEILLRPAQSSEETPADQLLRPHG